MVHIQTDCLEKLLNKAFEKLGICVGQYPWCFLIVPVIVSAGLGSGFMNVKKLEANDMEEQFTPSNGQAKIERAFIQKHFSTDYSHFSPARLSTEGMYVSFIAVSKGGNILTKRAFEEILSLDKLVNDLKFSHNNVQYNYSNLCAKVGNSCFPNPLLDLIKHDPNLVESTAFTYPRFNGSFIGTNLGGVTLDSGYVKEAHSVKSTYYLREDTEQDKVLSEQLIATYIQEFPKNFSTLKWIKVSHITSMSRQEQFEKNGKTIIPLFSITYFLTINFAVVSCMRLDCVRNKVWVSFLGVISAGLAVLAGFGLLLHCGVSFAINTANSPFLILGIGVDDMFIMLSSWQKTNVEDNIEDRMGDTYAKAATSITITTLTDVLAFYTGCLTFFPSVQSFCVYTGTTVLLCFIYNITFFGAVLALNGRREGTNRHWLTFKKVENYHEPGESKCYAMCCVGGAYDEETGTELEHPMSSFIHNYYGPFLTNCWTKGVLVVLYIGYLAISIYGCLNIKEGIDIRNLVNDYSYVITFYDDQSDFFTKYGPRVMVSVTESVEYWNSTIQDEIDICMVRFEQVPYVDRELSESWLRTYINISKQVQMDIKEKNTFIGNLSKMFQFAPLFKQDIKFSDSNQTIIASRFFIQTINVNNSVAEKNLLIELRKLAQECKIPLLVYHPAFIYFDQYLVIISNTIQNVAVAAGAMLIVALLLIPNPVCSLWVTFSIASVLVGVAGFMTFWGVNLDSISMINLVICIGFSVDFTAHISYAFVSSDSESANDRCIDALYNLGYPILQGALSTIIGVVALAGAASYIFRTFFKIIFLVISFGTIHGVMFMPIFMTFFHIC
ncbi:patched domain-containing protein 3-like [Carcharodon carcharias]|uniref:patched domain-containing protein 3-like n=1 Tax=Carcharodon carcharias TaxID=13397 RepID=UPI001B7E19DA|nr:patched domain-containing protein 3-like [Carcharodon carcharias]